MPTLHRTLTFTAITAFFTMVGAIIASDGTRKAGDENLLPLSWVSWNGQRAGVPQVIMMDLGLTKGQAVTDEQAKDVTDRLIKYFKLERTR